jgi:adenylyltransferase/sulfurtransferase
MPVYRIPAPLRTYTEGKAEVEVNGATVDETLVDLVARFPALKPHLFQDGGELRAFVNLYKGPDNIHDLNGFQTSVAESDRLLIIPSIAGGLPDAA